MVSVYGEQEQGALQAEIQWKNPSPKEHYDWPISGGVQSDLTATKSTYCLERYSTSFFKRNSDNTVSRRVRSTHSNAVEGRTVRVTEP